MPTSLDRSTLLLAMAAALLAGCANDTGTSGPRSSYFSTYKVESSAEVHAPAAEAIVAESVAASTTGVFDKPIVLLRAPQPVMPPEDTDAGVSGRVVVQVAFDELGAVENVAVLSTTKASLTEAVLRAVSQWRIAPASRDGKPQKVVIQAPFQFQTRR